MSGTNSSGQEVGCRLSTVTVQACSPRWTLTTFRLGAGDHETDVFITLAAAYRRKMPARQGVIGRVAPGACTKSKSDPEPVNRDSTGDRAARMLGERLEQGGAGVGAALQRRRLAAVALGKRVRTALGQDEIAEPEIGLVAVTVAHRTMRPRAGRQRPGDPARQHAADSPSGVKPGT